MDSAVWVFLGSALIAAGSLAGILVTSRGNRDATKVSAAAQTVEAKAREFTILTQTLDAVVEDQARQREEAERVRVALASCLTDRRIARENERRLVRWIRDRHPGEPVPVLLDQENGDHDYTL